MTKIHYVEGDLFAGIQPAEETIYLAHVCNCEGAWGAGFVVPLGRRFPAARDAYKQCAGPGYIGSLKLGKTQFVDVQDEQPKVVVANMVAQVLGGQRPLYYNYLAICMEQVAAQAVPLMEKGVAVRIICPMFGAGLAGGDWNIIEKLIWDTWIRPGLSVTVYYLPGTLPDNWTLPETQ